MANTTNSSCSSSSFPCLPHSPFQRSSPHQVPIYLSSLLFCYSFHQLDVINFNLISASKYSISPSLRFAVNWFLFILDTYKSCHNHLCHVGGLMHMFKYIFSIEPYVNHRIQEGWLKWRKASSVLCDTKVSLKLKEFFFIEQLEDYLNVGRWKTNTRVRWDIVLNAW